MFVDGIPIWEQLIYYAILLTILLCGLFVIIGFLVTHAVVPFMEFVEDIKRKEEMDKERNNKDD